MKQIYLQEKLLAKNYQKDFTLHENLLSEHVHHYPRLKSSS